MIGRHTFYNFSFLTEAKCAVDGRVPLDGRSNDAVTRYLSRKNSGRLFVSIPGARLCAKSEARAQRRALRAPRKPHFMRAAERLFTL